MLALSVSTTRMPSPSANWSPEAAITSMTSTASAPPISGTSTSSSAAGPLAAEGSACLSGLSTASDSESSSSALSGGSSLSSGCGASSRSPEAADSSAESVSSAVFSISRMGDPSLTLSPSFTNSFLTWPAWGLGTSMVALSDSNTMRDCSSATVSPTATHSSMTSTVSAPPRSGTRIVSEVTVYSRFQQHSGLALSGSRPNSLIALATRDFSIFPSSASAPSAATAMK